MGRTTILAGALGALWLLLSGYFDKPLLLSFGAISVALSVWLSARAGVLDGEGVPTGLMPRIFGYWLWLAGEIGKANILVARQALSLKPTCSPTMVYVRAAPTTNVGLAAFANSITLTPGTVSVNLEPGRILIHALSEELADVAAIEDMGDRVARAEGGGR